MWTSFDQLWYLHRYFCVSMINDVCDKTNQLQELNDVCHLLTTLLWLPQRLSSSCCWPSCGMEFKKRKKTRWRLARATPESNDEDFTVCVASVVSCPVRVLWVEKGFHLRTWRVPQPHAVCVVRVTQRNHSLAPRRQKEEGGARLVRGQDARDLRRVSRLRVWRVTHPQLSVCCIFFSVLSFVRTIYRIFISIYRICLSLKNSSSLAGIRDEFYYVCTLKNVCVKSGEVPHFGNGFSKSNPDVLITTPLYSGVRGKYTIIN